MERLDVIEQQIRDLSPDELDRFRNWFSEFDQDSWDQQMEADARSGKLDKLASKALEDHAAGRTTKL